MASKSTKSAAKKAMKSTGSMKSRAKDAKRIEEKQKLKAIARRKKYSTIARPRDWKRKGHAYRISAARRRSGLLLFLEICGLRKMFVSN